AQLTAPRWRYDGEMTERGIALTVDAPSDLFVLGWPSALREALTNLVFNAVDVLPRGGAIHLVGVRQGENVEISVQDSGAGMSPEVQSRLFEPFFTTKGERGSGLGL